MTTSLPFTKIVCTLGPACSTEKQILELAKGGMTIARLNFSHGNWEQHRETIRMLHRVNTRLQASKNPPYCIGIMLDTKGPEVRTGVVDKPLDIKANEEVVFSYTPRPKEKRQVILVNHKYFAQDVRGADSILLDNGKMEFALVKVDSSGAVVAKALESGSIGSRRHVNLPGANLRIDSVTERDWEDIAHGVSEGIDFIALSFVREAKEIEEVRAFLKKKKQTNVRLIAKVETRQAVENMESVVAASDAVMVARGDLGAEVSFERIPVIQDQLVAMCRDMGKPVIVATHMLESMIDDPMPTRAEVTDIAHAATSGTDTTMLSGETASGKYPLKALDAMARVLKATEDHLRKFRKMEEASVNKDNDARASAAVTLAISTDATALVVMTRTGLTARDISRFRPTVPIIAFTHKPEVQRSMQILYGVIPVLIPFSDTDPEQTVATAFIEGKKRGLFQKGAKCVLVSDAKAHKLTTRSIQMRLIP